MTKRPFDAVPTETLAWHLQWALAVHARRALLRDLYGHTEPREGLCAYDAAGMDLMEGRR